MGRIGYNKFYNLCSLMKGSKIIPLNFYFEEGRIVIGMIRVIKIIGMIRH